MSLFDTNIDIKSILFYLLFFFIAPFMYIKYTYLQAINKLESAAQSMEMRVEKAKKVIIKRITKKPTKEVKDAISNFLEFFVIEPVSLDPYGIIKKFEHLTNIAEERFKYFVQQIVPKMNEEEKNNLIMGLSGAISLNEIAKLLRHYVEFVKKTKNYQLALIFQMNLPTIDRLGAALLSATEALSNGWAIGDGIGNMVAANMVEKEKWEEAEEGTIVTRKKINGRKVIIVKAKGPGGRVGKLGRVVEKLCKGRKIAKIITIDAAAKKEGEKTGSVAEGVGVAIGGIGVDRSYIENVAVDKNIPLDSIVIKMSAEEAVMPMSMEILNSLDKVNRLIKDSISRTTGRGDIILVGVGNSCGIGNEKKAVEEAKKKIKTVIRMVGKREKKKGFFYKLKESLQSI